MASLPNPDDVWEKQDWPAPADLDEAKDWLARFRSGTTRRARNNDSHPKDKIAKVLNLIHILWNEMEQEVIDDLIANGRANATHFCLTHNPAGAGGWTDKECIHRKKARFTISRVLVRSRYSFDIKKDALFLWINNFLPKVDPAVFNPDELQKLRNRVR